MLRVVAELGQFLVQQEQSVLDAFLGVLGAEAEPAGPAKQQRRVEVNKAPPRLRIGPLMEPFRRLKGVASPSEEDMGRPSVR